MNLQNKALDLLGVSQWHVRGALIAAKSENLAKRFVLLAEKKNQFSPQHQDQLGKILDYLKLKDACELVYADDLTQLAEAELLLSFGAHIPDISACRLTPCRTFSISEMISNPSCKRQVMNDIKPIKDYCA